MASAGLTLSALARLLNEVQPRLSIEKRRGCMKCTRRTKRTPKSSRPGRSDDLDEATKVELAVIVFAISNNVIERTRVVNEALHGRGAFCKPVKVHREVGWRYQKCEC